MKKYYNWQEISIKVNTDRSEIFELIESYTLLEECIAEGSFDIELRINQVSKQNTGCNQVNQKAELLWDNEIELEGKRNYKAYTLADEYWSILEGYGITYIDQEKRIIVSEIVDYDRKFPIYLLLLFIIRPLNQLLMDYFYYRLHAASINIFHKNILISGLSGSGKSTATFALLAAGGRVLSDEMPIIKIIEGEVKAYPLYKLIKVQKDSVERFFPEYIDNFNLFEFDNEYYINIFDYKERCKYMINKIDAIFILNKTGHRETVIKGASPLNVVRELFPGTVNVANEQLLTKSFGQVMKVLNILELYQVDFGTDMSNFVLSIKETLNSI